MSSALIGQLLALLSAMSFACSNIFIAREAKGERNIESGVIFSIFITLILSLLVWFALEGATIPVSTSGSLTTGILWFSVAGLAAMVLGRSLIYRSVRDIGVIRASAIRRLNPFFSAALAFIVLGEVINFTGMIGMGLVGASILALVLAPILKAQDPHASIKTSPPLFAYGAGIAASFAYAISYLCRKFGLFEIGAPAFGTLVSALAGFLCYFVLAIPLARYREAIAGMFSNISTGLVMAGILMSVGQILLFAALFYERIAIVAIISSLELFFSTILAVLSGTEKRPDRMTMVSGIVATLGVVLIALSSDS